jgi:hypothetical protein
MAGQPREQQAPENASDAHAQTSSARAAMATNHGAQVPEVGAQAQLFGTATNGSGSRSPLERSLYSNGLRSNHASLLELDKALNYEVRIVTGNSNKPLAQEIANHLRVRITAAEVSTFSDGEIRVAIGENVRGKDVFLIQSTSPPVNDHLMELLVIIDTLKRASAKRITAVMPYYGYGRQGTTSSDPPLVGVCFTLYDVPCSCHSLAPI